MKHEIRINYKVKYVWIGIFFMILLGVLLFSILEDFDLTDIITYIAGVSATLTLLYHSFNLEYQVNAQKKNTDMLRAKYTYDIISNWSHPNMRVCVNEVRSILKNPDRIKELEDINRIVEFTKYLEENKEHRGYLVQTLNYFENIATMMDTGYIDNDIIKKSFKSLFVSYYKVLKNYIDFRQKEYPDSWVYYEIISKKWIQDNKTA